MTQPPHTPAPWKIQEESISTGKIFVQTEIHTIASIKKFYGKGVHTSRANARIIAALERKLKTIEVKITHSDTLEDWIACDIARENTINQLNQLRAGI